MSGPTVQQILAFEADCNLAGTRRMEAARRRFGLSPTRYVQLLQHLIQDTAQLTLALELDPATTRHIRDRLEHGYAARERMAGRNPR